MSTIIRLSIVGKTHQHTYRVVAQDKRAKRDGRFLEILGNINPFLAPPKQIVIKKDRIAFWQKSGAQLSPTVEYILKNGKLPPRPKKERAKKDESQPAPQAQGTSSPQEQEAQAPTNGDVKVQDKEAETQTNKVPTPVAEEPKSEAVDETQNRAQETDPAKKAN